MTDLEITQLCAEAMGQDLADVTRQHVAEVTSDSVTFKGIYDPLHDDAQAMALVKKLYLRMYFWNWEWRISANGDDPLICTIGNNLNRAICECVAKMQEAKCRTP